MLYEDTYIPNERCGEGKIKFFEFIITKFQNRERISTTKKRPEWIPDVCENSFGTLAAFEDNPLVLV